VVSDGLQAETALILGREERALAQTSGVPRNFVRGGVQQIQFRTEDRENGDLAAVAP